MTSQLGTVVADHHAQAPAIVLPAKRLILLCRPVGPDQPAGPTLREAVINQQFPQPPVLVLQRTERRRIEHRQPVVLCIPVVKRRTANAGHATKRRRLHARLMLAQHPNDLLFNRSASPHHSSASDELAYQWHKFRGASEIRWQLSCQYNKPFFCSN